MRQLGVTVGHQQQSANVFLLFYSISVPISIVRTVRLLGVPLDHSSDPTSLTILSPTKCCPQDRAGASCLVDLYRCHHFLQTCDRTNASLGHHHLFPGRARLCHRLLALVEILYAGRRIPTTV